MATFLRTSGTYLESICCFGRFGTQTRTQRTRFCMPLVQLVRCLRKRPSKRGRMVGRTRNAYDPTIWSDLYVYSCIYSCSLLPLSGPRSYKNKAIIGVTV